MSLSQRILVPCDFSSPSQAALQQGARMAETTGAELILLHILPDKAQGAELTEQRENTLQKLLVALPGEQVLKLKTQSLVRSGPPAREIINVARELAVDMIIMGTRGRSGIAHLALGSVAETVLRTASCPVMTVRSQAEATPVERAPLEVIPENDELELSAAVDLLRRAFSLRASDVHIDPINQEEYLVRMRIDGKLEEYCRLDRGLALRQLHQLEILARVESNQTFRAKEGRLRVLRTLPGAEVRYTSAPVSGGDAVAMRISSRMHVGLPLENLGLPEGEQAKVDSLLRRGEGLLLVTGPTGAGKTTTVYAMLNRLGSTKRNIVSIEDPVEYLVPFVRQLEVDERHDVTMTSGLKTLLRMDPDVVFVGEIRDTEAATIAMRAASSGRHVLSTLHARDVASTITALRDLRVEENSLAANLTGVLNQRLVRRICLTCRAEAEITDAECEVFVAEGLEPPAKLFHSTGCDACRQRGFFGRVGVFEVACVTPPIAEAISQGASEASIRQLLRAGGTSSLRTAALRKVLEGVTSLSEIDEITSV